MKGERIGRTVTAAAASVLMLTASGGSLTAKIAEQHSVKAADYWYGGERTVFDFKGYDAWLVEPPSIVQMRKDRPWTWTMQWRDAFVPRTGVPRLLRNGYLHVSVDIFDHHMDETGMRVAREFQSYLVEELGLAPKARLIGMSWGGFFSIRYAAAYPTCVDRIYLDAPLLNFDGFTGVPEHWAASRPTTGWSGDPRMPVNMAAQIVEAGIPMLVLYGGVDAVVPPAMNILPFAEHFKSANGRPENLVLVNRAGYAHHPHGVEESENTIVEFLSATR